MVFNPDLMSAEQAARVLNISSGSSVQDIKQQFRMLARRHHPDKVRAANLDELEQRKSTQKMRVIIQAFETLVPKHQRKERPCHRVVRQAEARRNYKKRGSTGELSSDDEDSWEDAYDYWSNYFDDLDEQGWQMQEEAVERQEVDDDLDAGFVEDLDDYIDDALEKKVEEGTSEDEDEDEPDQGGIIYVNSGERTLVNNRQLDKINKRKRQIALGEDEHMIEDDDDKDDDGEALVCFGEKNADPVLGAEDDIPELSPWVSEATINSKCPICAKGKGIRVTIDRGRKTATVRCLKCRESFTMDNLKATDAPVDVFCAWVDDLAPQPMLTDGNDGKESGSQIKKGGKWLGWTQPLACFVNSYSIPREAADRYVSTLPNLGITCPADFKKTSVDRYLHYGWSKEHAEKILSEGKPRWEGWSPEWAIEPSPPTNDKDLKLPLFPKLSLHPTNPQVGSPSELLRAKFASVGMASPGAAIRRCHARHPRRRTKLNDPAHVPTPTIALPQDELEGSVDMKMLMSPEPMK